jgi:TorA maturation chaperone TorD
LRTDSCLQAVKLWLQYKAEKREGYKKTGLAASLTKWSREFTAADFPTAVENSIASGWRGIFSKKDSQPSLPIASAHKKQTDWRDSL